MVVPWPPMNWWQNTGLQYRPILFIQGTGRYGVTKGAVTTKDICNVGNLPQLRR